jgi:hypothetical protein
MWECTPLSSEFTARTSESIGLYICGFEERKSGRQFNPCSVNEMNAKPKNDGNNGKQFVYRYVKY